MSTNKIDLVRAEVEKLKSNLVHGACSSQIAMETRCKEEAYNEVLAILNTMQEEPASGLDNGDMPIERWKQAVEAASNQRNYRSSKGLTETRDDYFVDGVQWADEHPKKEPVSEDLGGYINELSKQFPEVSFAMLSGIADMVSRWQRNQDAKNKLPKVINRTDLDEFAYQCAYDLSNDWAIDNPTWHDVEDACKLGAKWQKEQDQSTIELAEDHAMLAGMEQMKEQMMKEPNLSGYVARDEDGNLHVFEVEPKRLEEEHRWWDRDYNCHFIDNDAFPDLRWKDEPICVKLIIIKED